MRISLLTYDEIEKGYYRYVMDVSFGTFTTFDRIYKLDKSVETPKEILKVIEIITKNV